MPGAGGKSLINSLHLCDGVIFNDLDNSNNIITDLDKKFQRIMDTVPDLESTKWWCTYEIHNIIKGCDGTPIVPAPQNSLLDEVKSLDGFLPLVTHTLPNRTCYENVLGPGKRIKFIPDAKFIDTAIKIKWKRNNPDDVPGFMDQQYIDWEKSFHNTMFDAILNKFDPLNSKLFDYHLQLVIKLLKVTPHWDLINQYLKKYRDYHFAKIQELNLTSYY